MENPINPINVEEYLRMEQTSSEKHEYFDGEIYVMSGGTMAHSVIASNIGLALKAQLKGSGCRVHISDLKVMVDATNSFYYPDVFVECGDYDKDSLYTKTPVAIFEVLSKSTATIDRREKLFAYKRLESLKAYFIVQQSRKRITAYLRDEKNNWCSSEFVNSGELLVANCSNRSIRIALDEIYEDCDLDDNPDLQVREEVTEYAW